MQYVKMKETALKERLDFDEDKGTAKSLPVIKVLSEEYREYNKPC